MSVELSNGLIAYSAGGFLAGLLLSSLWNWISAKRKARKRDPRDNRIRELEAELRIATSDSEKSQLDVQRLEEELAQIASGIESRDSIITEQQARLSKAKRELKGSIAMTRKLRSELADRATENLHAEAKIREVETELSVAQASTDLIASSVLDYSLGDDEEEGEPAEDNAAAEKGDSLR